MALSVRAADAHAIGTANGATLAEPAGTSSGDLLVALALSGVVTTSLGAPAGWTTINSGNSTNTHFRYIASWVARGGSAPSLTWTMSTSDYREVYIIAVTGATTSALDATGTEAKVGNVNAGPNPPAVTAVDSAALAVALGIQWSGCATAWAHAAYTIRSNNAAGNDGVVAFRQLSASGSEDPAAFTGQNGAEDWWAQTITIAPAAGGGTTVKQLAALGVG